LSKKRSSGAFALLSPTSEVDGKQSHRKV